MRLLAFNRLPLKLRSCSSALVHLRCFIIVVAYIRVLLTDRTNANGLTDEEQAKYEEYYTLHDEYNPDQPIPIQSRTFGIVEEDNPFLSSEASDGWSEGMV